MALLKSEIEMTIIRTDLRNGLIVLVCFLVTIIMTDLLLPSQIDLFEYQRIDPEDLTENPISYEGERISTYGIITSVNNTLPNSHYYAETEWGLILLIPSSDQQVQVGDRVNIRGISLLVSSGYFEVTEMHIADQLGPLLKSVPGIIGFVILFFVFFKLDLHGLAFIPRSEPDA